MPFDNGTWTEFCGELQLRTVHFAGELSGSWKHLAALLAVQRESFAQLKNSHLPAEHLHSFDEFFAHATSALLIEPFSAYGQKRPLQRSLSAMEQHEVFLEDLARRLPRVVQLSGQDLVNVTGVDRHSLPGLQRSLQRKPTTIHLRDAVSHHLQQELVARAALDGAFQLLLAQCSLHLLVPWQTCRRAYLAKLTQSTHEQVDIEDAHKRWMEASAQHEERAALLLARYETWSGSIPARIARRLLASPHPASQEKQANWTQEHQKHLSFWSRQQRAVRSVIDLELHLEKFARATTQETIAVLEALGTEHTELIQEIDTAIAWLRQWTDGNLSDSFPQPTARLLSSEERLSEWLRRVSAIARQELPLTIETIEPRQALPGWHKPWRDLEPSKVFLTALSAASAPILLSGFQEAEAAHRAMVREIERAREVVDFGFESAKSEGRPGEPLAKEAVDNALALLIYQKETAPEIRAAAESSALHAEANLLLESDIALEKSRVGLLAHATRRRGGEGLRQLRGLAQLEVQAVSRHLWSVFRGLYRWGLLKIGLIAAPRQAAEPVVLRADLGETLEVQLHARDLPMIYRRLFRLAPVEDPRFLIGRDAEMAGFANALKCWENGRGASVIVIGARGSGKTSLINCAAAAVFGACEVIRGQFCERMVTPPQMAGFLRGLLQIPADSDVVAVLGERRRVVLVEEFERTFLRMPNGFDALRMLLDLMYSTAHCVLWVFSVNETAYRYLNAVTGLRRHFSHHINAMSVKQSDLTSAILQRHGLSGLRLEFAPLSEEDPRVSRVRRFFGFEQDPQKLFLEALYEQSEGIFRAAFELWQGSIERVEGGVVHMRQPLAPDYKKLAAEVTLDDCFALAAILQHGSLTAEELARVLATSREESQRQLQRLQLLDVLEPEPASPGVRVRPEAGRLVRETLNRRNLL